MKKIVSGLMAVACSLSILLPSATTLAGPVEGVTPRAGVPVQGWVAGDGHSHTSYSSDGKHTPAEMIQAARDAGLNYLVITDHNNSDAYHELAANGSNVMLTTLWGQEYTKHPEGHATIMSTKAIRNYKVGTGGAHEAVPSLDQMVNEVHAAGGLAIAAHPFDKGDAASNTTDYPMKLAGWRDLSWDAWEVWNGYYGGRHAGTVEAFQEWDAENRAGKRLYGVAQSDAHDKAMFGKTCYTRAYVQSLTAENLLNAYRKGNVYGTNGPTLEFTVNGAMMGSEVRIDNNTGGDYDADWENKWEYAARTLSYGSPVNVHIGGSYSGGLKRGILILNRSNSNSNPTKTEKIEFALNGATSFSKDITVGVEDGDFLRFELEGNDGNTLTSYGYHTTGFAFSNPIFITTDGASQAAALNATIADANALKASTAGFAYTAATVNNFNAALSSAQAVYNRISSDVKNRPSSSEIGQANTNLTRAIQTLNTYEKIPKSSQGIVTSAKGNVYYVSGDYLSTGLMDVNGAKYYFSELSGTAQLRWQLLGGKWYYFDVTTAQAKTGFYDVTSGSTTHRYYSHPFPDCSMATGAQVINGKRYVFNGSGAMQYKWYRSGNAWYYLDPKTGAAWSGWQQISGKWYYFLPGSDLTAIGVHNISGKLYAFDSSAAWVRNGWFRANGDIAYVKDDVVQTGWLKDGSTWYYVDHATGKLKKGWLKEGNKHYYLHASTGVMQKGWTKVGNTWYYMKSSGVMTTGWQKVSGKWYLLKSSGAMTTGWQKDGGKWYYMKSSGAMATGWQKVGNTWYYMKSSGVMATGWQKVGGKWYYLKPSGAMVTGSYRIGNKTHRFNASGVWLG